MRTTNFINSMFMSFDNYFFKEEDGNVTLTVNVPGYGQDDLKITYNKTQSYLIVDAVDEDDGLHLMFSVNFPVEKKSWSAKVENGILTVTCKIKEDDKVNIAFDD